ncbi:UDP-2,3-diacylglucosamine diphosphatase [Azospirillum thermophilum]|uniref:UDP-2,3-diacylglucosamine hydrolase n=1 Tax=Azospirillum thermophilum TaxID=2202148 RepID=A0A2S2CQ12_9PROT|nr:UDP-2,3-diacylglucosamine diphosphatase [Azospirillum thermophilum]AWK86525.1 UDP-2,3-diacylglucosamine hydrolase [Azospirillum thermophilum]
MDAVPEVTRYRSIWISDVHLGTRGCKADYLLDFLKHTESDHLFLVGDIVDGWRLRKSWYWPQQHNDVVQKILRRARKGVQVYYIPGNHDEAARDYVGLQFGGVHVVEEWVHTTADGRRFLITHGDRFDAVVRYAKWLALLGDHAYVVLLQLNTLFNWARRKLGFSYWSLSAYLKHKAKTAVEFIGKYEEALGEEARRRKVDGIICGHIHTAEMRDMEGVLYCNDGDWVESCTALVEHHSGALEIIHWAEVMRSRDSGRQPPARTPEKAKAAA